MADNDHDHDDEVAAEHRERLETVSTSVLVHEGELHKQGQHRHGWKKRWFQISSDTIAYYDKKGGNMKGGILLETVTGCRNASPAESKKPHSFSVDTTTGRNFLMYASSDDERADWMAKISETVEKLTPPEPAPPKKKAAPLVIAYWKIRGLGAPLRMMAHYAGDKSVEFTSYEVFKKDDGSWDRSSWFCDEAKGALKKTNFLINLPYIKNKDSGHVVTQSNACTSYLARRYDLFGNEEQTAANEQLMCQTMDWRNSAVGKMYSTADKEVWEAYFSNEVKNHSEKFEGWLAQRGTKFLVADVPLASDFHTFEMIEQHEICSVEVLGKSYLEGYPRLKQYHDDFTVLPELQSYFASEYAAFPLNNKMASVGGAQLPTQMEIVARANVMRAALREPSDDGEAAAEQPDAAPSE